MGLQYVIHSLYSYLFFNTHLFVTLIVNQTHASLYCGGFNLKIIWSPWAQNISTSGGYAL